MGKVAEKEFMKVLNTLSSKVIDVSNDKEYQDKDIDMIAQGVNGNMVSFEVKRQMQLHYTRNMLLETVSSKYINSIGWWHKCKADWLVFDEPQEEQFHIFDRETLKEYVEIYRDMGLIAERYNATNNGKFYLMPLDMVAEEMRRNADNGEKKAYFKVPYVGKKNNSNKLVA